MQFRIGAIKNSAPLYTFGSLIHQYNILFSTNHLIQSTSRSVKTVSVQYCTHKQLQIPQITKPESTYFVSSINSHSPTYVRVNITCKSEFPYIQFNFFLSHAQEKLQTCGSKYKIKRLREEPVQYRIQYNTIKHPLLSNWIRYFFSLHPPKKSTYSQIYRS